MSSDISTYNFPTKIRFGPGSRHNLTTELSILGMQRPLVVTDRDVAKAIALLAHHPGHLFDYEDGASTRSIDRPIPSIVAIPTTAGTGSEVGRSAVISDDETHAKKIVFDPQLLPQVVLADPELLLGLPAKITAATGMDALTHLIEAFLAKGQNPLCDGIALEGIYLVSQHLKDCVDCAQNRAEPDQAAHLRARAGMLNASMMGRKPLGR